MKRLYTTPSAEMMEFDYTETVVASNFIHTSMSVNRCSCTPYRPEPRPRPQPKPHPRKP